MKIASTQQKKTLTFPKPIIRRTEIGKKPAHHFDQNSEPKEAYVATKDPFANGGKQTVWASIPDKNPDGSPVLQDTQETVDLTPRSPWKYGGIAGGVGALVGAGAGALLSGRRHPSRCRSRRRRSGCWWNRRGHRCLDRLRRKNQASLGPTRDSRP